ncbi:hypothetical protein [Pedobacter panaciterrae]
MEKYMGFRIEGRGVRDERSLPIVNLSGTQFCADISKHEFREISNPANRITMGGIKEEFGFSHFLYDRITKNIYIGDPKGNLPDHVDIILVPPIKDIDPVGLARRYGFADDHFALSQKKDDLILTSFSRLAEKQDQYLEATEHKSGLKIR